VTVLSVTAKVASSSPPPKFFVTHNTADVTVLVNEAADVLWPRRCDTKSWDSVRPETGTVGDDLAKSQASYQRLVYDMTAQAIATLCDSSTSTAAGDTLQPWQQWQLSVTAPVPQSASKAKPQITASVLKQLGLESHQPPLLPRYSGQIRGRRGADLVDRLLAAELVKEESAWTNYKDEELFVKQQVADMLYDMLISETVDTLSGIVTRKRHGHH